MPSFRSNPPADPNQRAAEARTADAIELQSRLVQLEAAVQQSRDQLQQVAASLAALRIDEARSRFLCDQAPQRMGVVELLDDCPDDLRVVWVNRAFLDFYKVTLHSVLGKRGQDLGTSVENRKPWMEGYWRAWTTQTPITVEIFESSHDAWMQALLAPLPPTTSGAKQLAFVVANITERKAVEASLRESEDRFRLLFENSPDAIFVEDAQGRVHDVNPAACKLHDLKRSELIGRNVLDLVPPERRDLVREDFRRLQAGEIRSLKSFSLKADGSAVPIELTCSAIAFGGDSCLLLHVRDISERQSIEEAVRTSQELEKKLLEAQKLESLGILAGGVAHDFNNLLAIILGNASMLEGRLSADSPLRTALDPIVRASERAAELCNQMLAYSGRGKFVVEPVDLNRVIQDTLGLLELSLHKKATLLVELAAELPLVDADVTQLRQILMNLVINAGEAIENLPGTIEIATALGPAAPDGQPSVVLAVTDSGCGMDDATRSRIFDPFFTTKFTGRGLGLASVQGIVRGHKGTIAVDSEPGKGSCFRVHLPASTAVVKTVARAVERPTDAVRRGQALIVDDEADIRQLMTRMLQALGFETKVAKDGEQALERFREAPESFDLVFLDLTMPRLDGQETFRLLHLLRPELPVILMSGYTEQEAAAKFVGKKVAGFITKPFTVQRLEDKIRSVLK
ncbi:MAG: PAS domain S-box protein [Planctomycetota bacterium]